MSASCSDYRIKGLVMPAITVSRTKNVPIGTRCRGCARTWFLTRRNSGAAAPTHAGSGVVWRGAEDPPSLDRSRV